MSKRPSLLKQLVDRLDSKLRYGQSKHKAKQVAKIQAIESGEKWNPARTQGIYSGQSRKTYQQQGVQLIQWTKLMHPEIKWLDDIKDFVGEYLQQKIDSNYSANTIHTAASAAAKIYGCKSSDFGVQLPPRKREEIKRSRSKSKRFSYRLHSDLVMLGEGAGLRRKEVKLLEPDHIYELSGRVYVHVVRGKGGKSRVVVVREGYEQLILKMRDKALDGNLKKLITKFPDATPWHEFRRSFAQALYREIQEKVKSQDPEIMEQYYRAQEIWKSRNKTTWTPDGKPHNSHRGMSNTIRCRDGSVFDRTICVMVSLQLGHNREDVVYTNYLR